MSSKVFVTKQGDTSPITIPFVQGNGAPVDFTGATGVTFSMRNRDTRAYVLTDAACTLVSATLNGVTFLTPQYAFQAADVALPGVFDAEVRAVLGGVQLRLPHDTQQPYIQVTVQADLS